MMQDEIRHTPTFTNQIRDRLAQKTHSGLCLFLPDPLSLVTLPPAPRPGLLPLLARPPLPPPPADEEVMVPAGILKMREMPDLGAGVAGGLPPEPEAFPGDGWSSSIMASTRTWLCWGGLLYQVSMNVTKLSPRCDW
jgi:hypothetical protein